MLEENKNQLYVAQGHNPKETSEMFIKKVQSNQKRINHTIQVFEQQQEKESQEKQKVDLSKAIRAGSSTETALDVQKLRAAVA